MIKRILDALLFACIMTGLFALVVGILYFGFDIKMHFQTLAPVEVTNKLIIAELAVIWILTFLIGLLI